MKEIPMPLIKANQTGIVLLILAAVILQQPLVLAALWLIQAAGLLFGPKANLFMAAARPFLADRLPEAETQAAELARFNNGLGMTFLTLSLIAFPLGLQIAGYVFAAMFALAAFVAICGFCVGCVLYFQFKQWKYRLGR